MYLSDLQIKHPLWRYVAAIVAIALAILLRYALVPIIGSKPAYITIFPAILIVAMLAGCAPALLTGLIGSIIAAHLFSPRPLHITYIEIASITLSALLAGFLAQQLHSSIERITESESFYHQTIESIPGLVFALKPDGSYEYVSRQASAYTGVPQNQELADRWTELVHPQDRRRAVAAWLKAFKYQTDCDLEYRVRRQDGAYKWFKIHGRPIRCEDGKIIRWFGLAVDIDSLKRAQDQLMHAKKLLDAQKEELEAIIHVVSHDLRAPLLNISGFNDILKDDCKTIREALAPESISNQTRTRLDEIFEQSAREAFEMINVSAAAMHRLIDSLVKVARAGLVVPTPEPIDMNHLLRNIIAGLRIKARQTGARIELADLPPCFADRTQTAQVFANL